MVPILSLVSQCITDRMASHALEDVELIQLGCIDVEDLPLSQFNRKSMSPHIDVFHDVNYMRFCLVHECQALLICPCATINIAKHFFTFQNPLCNHFCNICFLNAPWLRFIFSKTELLRQSALLLWSILLLLLHAWDLFIVFHEQLENPKGLAYCGVKLYL